MMNISTVFFSQYFHFATVTNTNKILLHYNRTTVFSTPSMVKKHIFYKDNGSYFHLRI